MPTSKTGSSGTRTSKKPATKTKRGSSSRVKSNGRLVIVESPAKARTIEQVSRRRLFRTSLDGPHSRSPEDTLGVDLEHDFTPKYSIPRDKSSSSRSSRTVAQRTS